MELLQILLLALVPTIAIELGVLLFVRERRRKVLLASVVMNILTNIPLNFLMICLEGDDIVLFTAEAVLSSVSGSSRSSIVSCAIPSVSCRGCLFTCCMISSFKYETL